MIQNTQPKVTYQLAFYDTTCDNQQPIATMQIDREDIPVNILDDDSIIFIGGNNYILVGYSQSWTTCVPERQTITINLGVVPTA